MICTDDNNYLATTVSSFMIQVETDVCHARTMTSPVHTMNLFITVTGFKKYNKNILPAYFYSLFSLFNQKPLTFHKGKKKANVLSSSNKPQSV